jgi:two-component sensor histidine kinase
LTRAAWGADLYELLQEQPIRGEDSRILFSGPDVFPEPQIALHFGMVLYELGSNARKYGALSRGDGRIEVHWAVERSENARFLAFHGVESASMRTPSQRHFGTRLIEFSLTHSLHGKVDLDFASAALRCMIEMPLGQNVFPDGVGKMLEE